MIYLFYITAASLIFSVWARFLLKDHAFARYSLYFSFLIGLLFYLLGMFRVNGIDFDSYKIYFADYSLVPDYGFKIIVRGFEFLSLTLNDFLILYAALAFFAIYVYSKSYNSNYHVAFVIYILHSAIVKDFAQIRIGLALLIFFLSISNKGYSVKCVVLDLISCSIHYTIIPFVVVYRFFQYCASNHVKITYIYILLISALLFLIGTNIDFFTQYDARINEYINWDQDNYGRPVSSYNNLFFIITLILLSGFQNLDSDTRICSFIMIFLSCIVALAFFDLAIFSGRLSNIFYSLYPFVIGSIYNEISLFKKRGFILATLITVVIVMCLLRFDTYIIIDSIVTLI